jgi:hypothetical protein
MKRDVRYDSFLFLPSYGNVVCADSSRTRNESFQDRMHAKAIANFVDKSSALHDRIHAKDEQRLKDLRTRIAEVEAPPSKPYMRGTRIRGVFIRESNGALDWFPGTVLSYVLWCCVVYL